MRSCHLTSRNRLPAKVLDFAETARKGVNRGQAQREMTRSTGNTLCGSKHALRSTPNSSETGNAMATPPTAKKPGRQARPATDPAGPTGRLATWVARTTLDDVPASVRDRAKHLV